MWQSVADCCNRLQCVVCVELCCSVLQCVSPPCFTCTMYDTEYIGLFRRPLCVYNSFAVSPANGCQKDRSCTKTSQNVYHNMHIVVYSHYHAALQISRLCVYACAVCMKSCKKLGGTKTHYKQATVDFSACRMFRNPFFLSFFLYFSRLPVSCSQTCSQTPYTQATVNF